MDINKLEELNKEFTENSHKMFDEFFVVFDKWIKKDPRLTVVNCIGLPLNILINLIRKDTENILPKEIEDLPEVFERYLKPFINLKSKWGKVSSKEFVELYGIEYAKQLINFL